MCLQVSHELSISQNHSEFVIHWYNKTRVSNLFMISSFLFYSVRIFFFFQILSVLTFDILFFLLFIIIFLIYQI